MTIERRKADRRVSPAVAEFALQERGELLARIEDLEAQLDDTESRRANAARNSSAFEDRMGDLQVENGKLSDRIVELEAHCARIGQGDVVAWQAWAVGDTVRYLGSGEHGEDCHLRMTIGSDYLIHEAPDEFETMIVLDDDGDEWSVLVGEFEYIAAPPATGVIVPSELHDEAECCAFVLENIGSLEPGDIDGDDIDLRFEDAEGRDTGSDISIVEYAERAAKTIRALLAQAKT